MNRAALSLLALGLIADGFVVPPACGQIPEGWEIVTITDDPEIFDNNPDINDRGQIVFHRRLTNDSNSSEVLLYDRGLLVQLTNNNLRDNNPRLNNRGEVVWSNGDIAKGEGRSRE
jgi:hypothetical protein